MEVMIPCKSEAIYGLFVKKRIIKKGRCERKPIKGDCLVHKRKRKSLPKGDAVVHEQRNKR